MATNCHLSVRIRPLSRVRQAAPRSRNTFVAAFAPGFPPWMTTMLPFLYQTRTLASLHGMGKKPVYQYKYTNIISRRTFSQCEIRALPDDRKLTTPEVTDESPLDPKKDTKEEGGGFPIRRVILEHGKEPNKFSFSYGRNTMHASRTKATATQWSNNTECDINQSSELEIPWGEAESEDMDFEEFGLNESNEEGDNIYQESETDEIQTLTRKSDPRQDRTSTITPSEKIAFQKIFSDIFARSQPTTPYGMDGLLGEQPLKSSDELKTSATGARESLDRIVDFAVQGRPQEEIEAAVNRYPPALRPAAARAMGLTSQNPRAAKATRDKAVKTVDETSIDDDKLELLRKPERDRVEGLMRSAKTDFELWAIMQKEVFSLISKLGLEQAPEEEEEVSVPPKKKRGKKPSHGQKESQDKSQQTHLSLDSPVAEMSPLEFYGPLYPSYLLLGLRLLDRSFARPSPLTLSILPEIKSLGIISHVLGGPTQLYNELLLIHWYRYDDFRGVLELLNEMEHFGLNWDKGTLDTIDHITELQKSIRNGDRGLALKTLWALPEFAPGRFKQWRNKIEQSLVEEAP